MNQAEPSPSEASEIEIFLANLRHGLRTPLNAIIGYSEILIEDAAGSPNAPSIPDLEKIRVAGTAMLSVVNSSLDDARLGSTFDVTTFAREARFELGTPLTAILGYTEILIEEAEDAGLTDAAADLEKIHLAAKRLQILIDEIYKLSHLDAQGAVLLASADMSDAIRDLIVCLHRLEEEGADGGAGPDGAILVVDDNELTRSLLARRLGRQGYTVSVAKGGQEALEMIESSAFDLILLDIVMPDLNGIQVLERLKQDPALRHIPVVMISALDEFDKVVKSIEIGAEDYLPMPFNPVLLRARVGACLEKKRLHDKEVAYLREVAKAREEALEANRIKSLFFATINHELRTPLTAILGYIQLLMRTPDRSAGDRDTLDIVMRSGEHLLGLINDLLTISKIEAGHATLSEQVFDLHDLLHSMSEMFQNQASARRLRFNVYMAVDVPRYAFGDDGKLRQILINLLGNAFKFTDSGSVEVGVSWRDGRAAIEVRDTGCGIGAEEFGQLFQPFTQTGSGRKARQGTGLGLAISQSFARMMDGEITVMSALGKGSTFRLEIRLPAAEPEAVAKSH
jgi:two-component system, sensor histidine kinase and response regulator